MTSALIGCTGFVGSNLARQVSFDLGYHRPDIAAIDGRHLDLLVCAGAPAEKWRANQEPEADRANLADLELHLARVTADRFVLISTVDVFPAADGVDETSPVPTTGGTAYGRHRLELEEACRSMFARCLVVRLPGMFGPGLKKNLLYDLLVGANLPMTHRDSTFQFYDVRRLWADVSVALEAGIDLLHLATEPLRVTDVAATVFGVDFDATEAPVARYDLRTCHAALFGRTGPYLLGADEVLAEMADWVASERAHRAVAEGPDA